jgi:hypothetical protein
MVIYDLICKKNHRFEGWFPNFEAFQEQVAKELISCPNCGTTKVEKLPHACAVISSRGEKETVKAPEQAQKTEPPKPMTETDFREMLFRLQHYVRANFEDVGPRFAEEARAIFDGRTEPKPIHGTATPEERRDLDEEGVPYLILPKPNTDD